MAGHKGEGEGDRPRGLAPVLRQAVPGMPSGATPALSRSALCSRKRQHAKALDFLLQKYPEQRAWLEKHGFDAQELIDALQWYPAEELASLDGKQADKAARRAQQERIRRRSTRNYEHMQENILRLLPVRRVARLPSQKADGWGRRQLVREVQEEVESSQGSWSDTGSSPARSREHYYRDNADGDGSPLLAQNLRG